MNENRNITLPGGKSITRLQLASWLVLLGSILVAVSLFLPLIIIKIPLVGSYDLSLFGLWDIADAIPDLEDLTAAKVIGKLIFVLFTLFAALSVFFSVKKAYKKSVVFSGLFCALLLIIQLFLKSKMGVLYGAIKWGSARIACFVGLAFAIIGYILRSSELKNGAEE